MRLRVYWIFIRKENVRSRFYQKTNFGETDVSLNLTKGEREKLFLSKSKFSITCEIHSWKELIEWVGCIFKILQKGKSNNKFYQRNKCYTKTSITFFSKMWFMWYVKWYWILGPLSLRMVHFGCTSQWMVQFKNVYYLLWYCK